MPVPHFRKCAVGELPNPTGGSEMNTLFTVGDVDGDGRPDIVVSGRNGQMAWFQNNGSESRWQRHLVGAVMNLECGGLIYPLAGSGRGDIINGSDYRGNELYWWENPGSAGTWRRRLIAPAEGTQFHDELIADVTGDGRLSLLFWNQGTATLFRCPLPEDPRQKPWPEIEVIAAGMREAGLPEEGLAAVDLDGDGQMEIIAGTHWYRFTGKAGERWERHQFAPGYITTVVAAADMDGDGRPEIVLSEGDACIYGRPEGGRCAWFKPGDDLRDPWEEHLVAERLQDPHSLQAAPLCGSSWNDLVVGEIGVRERYEETPPRLMIYENLGGGQFTPHVIDVGTGTHHARLADFRGTGRMDIASRPLHGAEKWNVHIYFNEG